MLQDINKFLIIILLVVFIMGCSKQVTISISPPIKVNSSCSFNNWPYPNFTCSPGDVLNVTAKDICYSGYSATVRDVPESLKEEVFKRYGIVNTHPTKWEVDHIVPLSIGGSNSINNLWPEAYDLSLGARDKDRVENLFHCLVCSGQMDLSFAQREIVYNWVAYS